MVYSRNPCELVHEVASRLPGSCTQLAICSPLSWSDQIQGIITQNRITNHHITQAIDSVWLHLGKLDFPANTCCNLANLLLKPEHVYNIELFSKYPLLSYYFHQANENHSRISTLKQSLRLGSSRLSRVASVTSYEFCLLRFSSFRIIIKFYISITFHSIEIQI